jgi:hypothetical protein
MMAIVSLVLMTAIVQPICCIDRLNPPPVTELRFGSETSLSRIHASSETSGLRRSMDHAGKKVQMFVQAVAASMDKP